MKLFLRSTLQVFAFIAFAGFVAWLSVAPRYQYADPGLAVLKLSLSHAANRVEPCVQLTIEEIAALPAYERRPTKCERERLPVSMQLEIDGEIVVQRVVPPAGLWKDGAASVYESLTLKPGRYTLTARLRDSDRTSGWDYTKTENVELQAARYYALTFKAESGGFKFQ